MQRKDRRADLSKSPEPDSVQHGRRHHNRRPPCHRGAAQGTTTDLTREKKGRTSRSPPARIVLTPVNDLAKEIGEHLADYSDGKYILTFLLNIPTEPETYTDIYSPAQITKDPVTGEDIRILAGGSLHSPVTVGENETIVVRTP